MNNCYLCHRPIAGEFWKCFGYYSSRTEREAVPMDVSLHIHDDCLKLASMVFDEVEKVNPR